MEKGYQKFDLGQIHFISAGTTGPKIVLLHESPLSNRMFEKSIPVLSQWSQVFAPDTPGYGNSDPLFKDAGLDEYASVLGAAIKNWAGKEKVLICGIHTGASLAIEIGNQFPKICLGLFLIGVPVYSEQDRADRIANWCPDIEIQSGGEHLMWAWNKYLDLWPTAPLLDRNMAVIEMLRVLDRYNWAYQQAFKFDAVNRIKTLSCPIRIAAAENEFLFSGSKNLAIDLNEVFTTFLGLDGAVPLRDPELFSTELKAFLETIQ